MNTTEEERKELTQEWQKRHSIADDDPLFAAVELFEIYANSLPQHISKTIEEPPSFGEFRDTLDKLDQISKRFTNVAQDLTNEIRKNRPAKTKQSGGFIYVAVAIILLGACVGYFYWNFF